MRLLLAEDERSLSRALVTILSKNGFEVDPVYDGKAALEAIESGNYDGAVLDIMMPKMNGLEVLKTIRDKENLIPILMLTAKAEIDDKVEDPNADNTNGINFACWKYHIKQSNI